MADAHRTACIRTISGELVDLENPQANTMWIHDDVPAVLSKLCRFGGNTRKFYSVAEHCLLVYKIAKHLHCSRPPILLQCLMHDAHEYLTGDVVSPIKKKCTWISGVQESLDEIFAVMLGIGWDDWQKNFLQVSRYDQIALEIEGRHLMYGWESENDIEPWEQGLQSVEERVKEFQDIQMPILAVEKQFSNLLKELYYAVNYD